MLIRDCDNPPHHTHFRKSTDILLCLDLPLSCGILKVGLAPRIQTATGVLVVCFATVCMA